jgi:type IV pilus assembly protein PilO
LNWFKALPKGQKIFLVVLAGGLFLYLYFNFLIRPKLREIKKLEEEIQRITVKLEEAKIKAAEVELMEEEYQELKEIMKKVEYEIPREKDIYGLLQSFTSVGTKTGMEFITFRPQTSLRKKDIHQELMISLSFTGGYHQVGEFLAESTKLSRIVLPEEIILTPHGEKTKEKSVSIKMRMVTFLFK